MGSVSLDRVLSCPTLPSLPGVAIKMLELVRQPDCTADKIAQVIQNDPALASKVLKTVNSSYYGLPKPCPNITRAVALLGMNTVKSLTLGLSLVDVAKGDVQQFDLAGYWRRMVYSAAAARIVAKTTRACDPDDAFVAALLQDVGMLACFAALGREYAAIASQASDDHDALPAFEKEAMGFDHAEAGAAMSEKWRLPEHISAATRFHHRPDAGEGPNAKMVQVVGASGDAASALTLADPQPKLVSFRRRMRQWFDIDGQTSDDLIRQTGTAAKELSKLLNLDTGAPADVTSILAQASEELVHHQVDMERKQSDLARQTVTDALTGAFNRKHFDAQMARAFDEATSNGTPVSVLFVDADKFKSVNDTLGHQAGDAVLIEVSRRVRATIGDSGTVCRYGGEEFAIILPGTGVEAARGAAEAVRSALESEPIDISSLKLSTSEVRQTVSVGVSCRVPGSTAFDSAGSLVHAADEAVYAAKKAGRNKVCVAPEPVRIAPAPIPMPVVTPPPARRFDDKPAASTDAKRIVMIVEDDALSAKMLEVLLTKHGNVKVVVAVSAEDALKLMHGVRPAPGIRPDLALVDINLPAMSGIDLVRACKASPVLRSIAMVTMSACTDEAERTEASAAGAVAYFDKAQLCSDLMGSLRKLADLMPPLAKAA